MAASGAVMGGPIIRCATDGCNNAATAYEMCHEHRPFSLPGIMLNSPWTAPQHRKMVVLHNVGPERGAVMMTDVTADKHYPGWRDLPKPGTVDAPDLGRALAPGAGLARIGKAVALAAQLDTLWRCAKIDSPHLTRGDWVAQFGREHGFLPTEPVRE